ncbi:IS21-like element helper ATPase IstB [Patescibacteria group bacterium]|nr:IS21-like element helper ATPase IstB [Patescibacteria group bacterium]
MKNDPLPDKTLENIRDHLKLLGLGRVQEVLDEELALAAKENRPTATVLERLLAAQTQAVTDKRIERRIKESRLPQRKLLADFDFEFQKGLDKTQIMDLATLAFVKRKQGLILAGSSGTGKSHIAKALLLIGCQKLYRCRYTTAADMLNDLLAGLSDDTLGQKLKKYVYPDILLIDEVGFDRLEQESARNASLFFKVIDGRYARNSTLLTTNVDFKALGDYLGDPVITTAIVDRMVHHSIIINIDGPSFRIRESRKINQKPKPTPA